MPEEEPSDPPSPQGAAAEPEPSTEGSQPSPAPPDEVGPQTLIADVLARRPQAARVLFEDFGLPCYRCPGRFVEGLAEGISYRGLDAEDVLARIAAAGAT